ncbi:hypothetical protein [Desulfurispora thermophila]|uniref:hypothetical protein n=1 Tax=Desulfurispora thermophila TaxID=265470 RepID=UPI0003763C64|nr:hypothetical protein [Desulfurispora thermophila]
MTEKTKTDFLNKVAMQVEINRLVHGDKELSLTEWSLIVAEHMGHLMAALRQNDYAQIEKEILHMAAPLMEMHEKLLQKN